MRSPLTNKITKRIKAFKLVFLLTVVAFIASGSTGDLALLAKNEDIKLEIVNSKNYDNQWFTLAVKLTNSSNKSIVVYKPELEDVCIDLLQIYFFDINGNESYYENCAGDYHIDRIILKKSNSIKLEKNESVDLNYEIDANLLTPRSTDRTYLKVVLILNYGIAEYSDRKALKSMVKAEFIL